MSRAAVPTGCGPGWSSGGLALGSSAGGHPHGVRGLWSGGRVGSVLDWASDWAVLGFAVWTVIAYVGMATGAAATLLVSVWLATLPAVAAGLGLLDKREFSACTPDTHRPRPRGTRLTALGVAGGVLFAVLIALGDRVPWPAVWAPAAVAVAVAIALRRHRAESDDDDAPQTGRLAHASAAAIALGFAVVSLLLDNSNADDAFYVNRATATAQLNRIPVRDVLFTNEQLPPISGAGLPLDALHALQGAVARLAGVEAPTVAYLLTPPIGSFLAIWALWRLLRAWAPRNALLCFALGCTYWTFSAMVQLSPGSLFVERIWQGKVLFVAWMVPTLYTLVTRWVSRQDARTALMLFGGALASLGLTASATFVTPLVFAAGAPPLLARRAWRALAVLAAAGCVPLVIGAAVTSDYGLSEAIGRPLRDNYWIATQVLATGMVAAIGALGLWCSPWLARAGAASAVVTGLAAIIAVLLVPGVLPTISEAAGLTDTLRRFLWVIPLPAMVGLLAAVPVNRLAAIGVAVALAVLLVGFGRPVWLESGHSAWHWPPGWKTNPHYVRQARAILARYHGSGSILAPKETMRAIALITVHRKAVNPRFYYTRILPEPRYRTGERRALTRLSTKGIRPRSPGYIRRSLRDLEVGLVCIHADKERLARAIGLENDYRPAFAVNALLCLTRRP